MNGENTSPVINTQGGTGSLRISVFFDSIARPAPNATVRIIDPNSNRIIEETRTNQEGQVENISLATPPIEYSMSPDQPRPFNQYNIEVTHPQSQQVSITNVQLFPDSTAQQNVSLKPDFSQILIPYPTLWGIYDPKIPESDVKRLPFPTGQVVLPEPVVPQLVTVHEGRPADPTAADYTVSFTDYIKNVASSEIYSTWPVEAIKANVLVILSFTLNRVYTEWYRGKGYDFTVTNSTAYDQAFTYGRNFYQEISDIVDELFTTYISKSDMIQPLFTQYSDGKRVKRTGWLSQWGSKELADQGLNALQILRNYYGSDIVLKQAKKVEGIPLSFKYVLETGSRGDEVLTIQQQLNAISNNYPLINKVVADGNYGPETAEAVRIFQEVFDLPVTGKVNFPTWYRISDIFVAISKLS